MRADYDYPGHERALGSVYSDPKASRVWSLAISAALVLIVCIRFFSEELGLLPRIAQYVDVPITLVALFCALLALARRGVERIKSRYGIFLYLFLLLSLLSAVINMSRTEALPVFMFCFNFAAPLIMAVVTIYAPLQRTDIITIVRTFFWLGVVQLAVGALYDLPEFFVTHSPDGVSGTFGLNAYQFTYFLGVWLLYVLGGAIVDASSKQRRWRPVALGLAVIAVYVLFYAAQYRAMLIFFTAVIVLALWASPARLSKRLVITVVLGSVSAVTLIIMGTAYPNLKLLRVFDLFEDTTPIIQSGKIDAVQNVWKMYGDIPHTTLVGSGPATFSSRAYEVFASKPRPEKEAIGALVVDSRGGELYRTDVAREYIESIPFAPIQGGTTVSSPGSSYTSLAAEVGTIGLIAYLSVYGLALRYSYRRMRAAARGNDALSAQLAFACFGGIILLLVQTLFDNWLETTRVTIPLWILIASLYALEQADGRKQRDAGQQIDVQSQISAR